MNDAPKPKPKRGRYWTQWWPAMVGLRINPIDRTLPPIDSRYYGHMVELLKMNDVDEDDIVRVVNDGR